MATRNVAFEQVRILIDQARRPEIGQAVTPPHADRNYSLPHYLPHQRYEEQEASRLIPIPCQSQLLNPMEVSTFSSLSLESVSPLSSFASGVERTQCPNSSSSTSSAKNFRQHHHSCNVSVLQEAEDCESQAAYDSSRDSVVIAEKVPEVLCEEVCRPSAKAKVVVGGCDASSSALLIWLRGIIIRYFVEWWLLEILSWCFSAICMAAIFGILASYNGRPIPSWPMGFTINGFISVFSGAAKSALLLPTAETLGQLKWNWFKQADRPMMDFERIDMASRGPWGALQLLSRTKGVTLTSIGAIVVLLALPLDLFFQQIVSYPLLWVPMGNASIVRALIYQPIENKFYLGTNPRIASVLDMDKFLQPNFIGNGTIPELTTKCPTSNCTWEPYETLAVCNQCADLSKSLTFGCYTTPADWLNNVTYGRSNETAKGLPYPNVTACGYYLNPDGNSPILMSGYAIGSDHKPDEALGFRIYPLVDVNPRVRKAMFGGSLRFKNVKNPLNDFLLSGTPGGPAGAYANNTPSVHECVLFWCVKTVQSTSYMGKTLENSTRSLQLDSPGGHPWKNFIVGGQSLARYLANFSLTLPSRSRDNPHGNVFSVDNVTTFQILMNLDQLMPSYLTATNDSSDPLMRITNDGASWSSQSVPISAHPFAWLPPNNITQHVEKLATIMSAVVRNTPPGKGELQTINGVAWGQRTFVETRWAWMTLPIAILGLSLFLLIATIAKCSKEESEVKIWKSSMIAVLFNGLGDEVQKKGAPTLRLGEARAKAGQLRVKL